MRTKLIMFLAVIIIIAAASAVFAEVLLTDNFNITGGDTTDLNTDLAIRQSGTLATKNLGEGYAYSGAVTSILSTGVLDLRGDGASLVYINNNFFTSLTPGGTLHYSAKMDSILGWSYITISNTGLAFGYGVSAAIEVAGAHAYLHSQTTPGVWKTNYLALPVNGWHTWDMYVTQASASIKHVEIFLDGGVTPVYTNDCDSANWAGGSVNLQASYTAQFDNVSVSISEVPEPASLAALMSGLIGISGLALRRRK